MSERLASPVSKGKLEDRDGPLVFWHSDLLGADLSIHARGVYADLAMRYNFRKRKAIFPSIRKIAQSCKVSVPTVIHSIKELEKSGLIDVNRTFGKASQYQLLSIQQWREWKKRKNPLQPAVVTVQPQTPVSDMNGRKQAKPFNHRHRTVQRG
jgi:DNA-binding transcriptional MocR family regulator